MKDKLVTCVQCGNEFRVTAQELERLISRGFAVPKRCQYCRRKKSKNLNQNNNEWRQKGRKRNKRGKESYWEEEG